MIYSCRLLIYSVVAAALLLAGCGGGEDGSGSSEMGRVKVPGPTRLIVSLDGYEGPASAGILMAKKRGYFEAAGLDVEVYGPASPDRAVPYVVERIADVTVSHQPEVVLAKSQGAPIAAIGSLVSRPMASLIWLKGSGIDDVGDLRGKTIATAGLPSQKSLLEVALAEAGLTLEDVEVEDVEYDLVPALVSGRADAIFGGSPNLEGVVLESRGLDPVVTPAESLQIPPYAELLAIARTDRIEREPDTFRRFMRSVTRGTTAALREPGYVARLIWNSLEKNPEATLPITRKEIAATFPLLSRSGDISHQQAEELIAWMAEEGLIEEPVEVSSLFPDGFL